MMFGNSNRLGQTEANCHGKDYSSKPQKTVILLARVFGPLLMCQGLLSVCFFVFELIHPKFGLRVKFSLSPGTETSSTCLTDRYHHSPNVRTLWNIIT